MVLGCWLNPGEDRDDFQLAERHMSYILRRDFGREDHLNKGQLSMKEALFCAISTH